MSNTIPGYRAGQTVTSRNCLLSPKNVQYGSGVIDATYAYDGGNTGYERQFRPGTLMGQVTASGLWRPCPRTTTTSTGAVTALVVVDARAFIVGDVISVGADTGITVTAINYSTNTLTIASTTVASGEAVVVADGSQTCRGILNEFVNLWDDITAANVDKPFSQLVIQGFVSEDIALGDLAAIRAASSQYITGLIWGDQQGQS